MEITEMQVRYAADLLRVYRDMRDRCAGAEAGTPNWVMWCLYDARADAIEATFRILGIEYD